MNLIENTDKYGLTKIEGNKVFVINKPLQLCIDETIYIMDMPDYTYDINRDLYTYLIQEYYNNNELSIRLYKEMKTDKVFQQFEKYNGKNIKIEDLYKEIHDLKNIVYNPKNNDKFIAIIDTKKQFIHIYEFIADSQSYKAKYIHAKYEKCLNLINHLDYSINQYSKEQYENIIQNPNNIEKCNEHKKIWRLDGNISIESFYNIIFCIFDKNEKYIKELFNK